MYMCIYTTVNTWQAQSCVHELLLISFHVYIKVVAPFMHLRYIQGALPMWLRFQSIYGLIEKGTHR